MGRGLCKEAMHVRQTYAARVEVALFGTFDIDASSETMCALLAHLISNLHLLDRSTRVRINHDTTVPWWR